MKNKDSRNYQLKIRPYQPGDKDAVINLWLECNLVVSHNNPERDIERKLQVNPEWFLIGLAGDEIVATCMAGYEGHRGWINYLAVSRRFQRQGIAAKMMQAAEDKLRAAGCPKINLQVRTSNADVIQFYNRIGYSNDNVIGLGRRLEPDGPYAEGRPASVDDKYALKSSIAEIRQRFDSDVERFSNLETGQTSTVDAPLALELIAEIAAACTPGAERVLDIGCGAGNFTLRLLNRRVLEEVWLVDLSRPMLDRAVERIGALSRAKTRSIQADIRELDLEAEHFDIVLAGAVLHHLRTENEWELVFSKIYHSLNPGGSFWIFDLVAGSNPAVEQCMRRRYGSYLSVLKDDAYRDHVFAYIEQEDTPRSLLFQIDLLRSVGFRSVEILHKNSCFAAFGGLK